MTAKGLLVAVLAAALLGSGCAGTSGEQVATDGSSTVWPPHPLQALTCEPVTADRHRLHCIDRRPQHRLESDELLG